jgi:probable F420-dependent oxidoreductase
MNTKLDIGKYGIFSAAFELQPAARAREGFAQLDAMGWSTFWIGETTNREIFANAMLLLGASTNIRVASGIANLQLRAPVSMNSGWLTVSEAFPDRFILGIGVSHASFVKRALNADYSKPLTTMRKYLDDMDAAEFVCPRPAAPKRMLGALGPKMMQLAAERTQGGFSYLMPPEHTAMARVDIGPDSNLSVEQMVVLETDPTVARDVARKNIARYLQQPNYLNSLRRVGFTDTDFGNDSTPPSDRVVDAIVAWGNEDAIVQRIRQHEAAGADHVAIQVLTATPREMPHAQWQRLADALL